MQLVYIDTNVIKCIYNRNSLGTFGLSVRFFGYIKDYLIHEYLSLFKSLGKSMGTTVHSQQTKDHLPSYWYHLFTNILCCQ